MSVQDPESYVHRIGRTGRAGALGESYSLMTSNDAEVAGSIAKVCPGRLAGGVDRNAYLGGVSVQTFASKLRSTNYVISF